MHALRVLTCHERNSSCLKALDLQTKAPLEAQQLQQWQAISTNTSHTHLRLNRRRCLNSHTIPRTSHDRNRRYSTPNTALSLHILPLLLHTSLTIQPCIKLPNLLHNLLGTRQFLDTILTRRHITHHPCHNNPNLLPTGSRRYRNNMRPRYLRARLCMNNLLLVLHIPGPIRRLNDKIHTLPLPSQCHIPQMATATSQRNIGPPRRQHRAIQTTHHIPSQLYRSR